MFTLFANMSYSCQSILDELEPDWKDSDIAKSVLLISMQIWTHVAIIELSLYVFANWVT